MEVTNEVRTKIFNLYIGCEVAVNNRYTLGYEGKLTGVTFRNISVHNPNDSTVFIDWPDGSKVHEPISTCQLLLTPLSSITDEDAIECVKYIKYGGNSPKEILLSLFVDDFSKTTSLVAGHEWLEMFDYLRSKAYMLPAYGIADLFEAGIAINATTLTDKSK